VNAIEELLILIFIAVIQIGIIYVMHYIVFVIMSAHLYALEELVLRRTVRRQVVLRRAVLRLAVLRRAVRRRAVLRRAVLRQVVRRLAVLRRAVCHYYAEISLVSQFILETKMLSRTTISILVLMEMLLVNISMQLDLVMEDVAMNLIHARVILAVLDFRIFLFLILWRF
jgi:hypothetical protein